MARLGIFLLLSTWHLSAGEYFVSPEGNDAHRGSRDQPFRTAERAVSAARLPGDSITFRAGIYTPQRTINLINPGLPGKPITIRSMQGETAVIDGKLTAPDSNLIAIGTSWLRIEGLIIRNAKGNGIAAWGSGSRVHRIEILDNTIHHCFQSGFFAGNRDIRDPVRDILAEGNVIHDVSLMNSDRSRKSWAFGLGAGLAKNITLRGNTVYRSHGEGIGLYLSDSCRIEGNKVHDNFAVNIYLDNTSNTIVKDNYAWSTGDERFFRFNRPTNGIQIANETYPGFSNPSRANTITGNLLVNNGAAFYYGSYQAGGGLRDTAFTNNTIHGSTGAMLMIDADPGHGNSRFENNIFYQTGRSPFVYFPDRSPSIAFRKNLWFGPTPVPASVRHPEDLLVDPLFTNPGGPAASNYHLRKGSPANGMGAGAFPGDN